MHSTQEIIKLEQHSVIQHVDSVCLKGQNDTVSLNLMVSIWTATCASWPSSSRRPACTWSGTGPKSSGSAWCRGQMSVNLTVRYENSNAKETLVLGQLFVITISFLWMTAHRYKDTANICHLLHSLEGR